MKGQESVDESPSLPQGQWRVLSTGVVALAEHAFEVLINREPIENVYTLDPEPIARGQFAVVYHCTHRTTGREYAAKFSSRIRMGADCSSDLVHEVVVSVMLKATPRTIHLVDVFSNEAQLILVMEYAPGGDLQTLLDENLVPYEYDVKKFMRQLLEGLAFIHDKKIVHLDIKPQNLVLMGEYPDCNVKLCDFEISRMLSPGHEIREILGTPDYVAPEILHYEPITTRTDMWSVGVLTYVLLTGFLPFGGESDQETFVEILKGEVDFPSELFEDVTPEAIDFIKKLLIRQPEQRMSAKESLEHTWMKKGLRRPTPPSTLDLTSSLNQMMSSTPTITVVHSNTTPTEPELRRHPILTKSPSDGSEVKDISMSSRDIGRPPLHPSSSQKSLFGDSLSVAGTPVTTPGITLVSPFIYRQESRFGSRHNLDRLRSMSKSREVLSERVQSSNIKKCLSKSRERLCDSKLGMSKSREKLIALHSLSHLSQSVEVLSALSHLTQQNNFYQSCSSIFLPKPNHPASGNNLQERMYQSLAAIDQIDSMSHLKTIGYFESRMSLDGEDYNDIVTQRNTDMNCFIGEIKFERPMETKNMLGLRGNSCRGGRGDSCDTRCTRHLQADSKPVQKALKSSRAEKMKKDAQKRRKEKKEHITKEKEKKERERRKSSLSLDIETHRQKNDSPSSPSFRRGSVSHVEQRLQERHERNQERMERIEREDKRSKKRLSVDHDKNITFEKPKTKTQPTLEVPAQRSRSSTPTRRKSRKVSSGGSDLSQTSSMESVNAVEKPTSDLTLAKETALSNEQVVSTERIPDLTLSQVATDDQKNNNVTDTKPVDDIEPDEAYVSLEDTSLDTILRSRSLDSVSSEESDKTIIDSKGVNTRSSSSSDDEPGIETLSVSEKIFGFEKGIIGIVHKAPPLLKQKSLSDLIEKNFIESKELPVIKEESPSPGSASPPSFKRSVSNTSDLGSIISDNSDYSVEKESPSIHLESQTDNLSPDWKGRTRSFSVYSNPSPPLSSPRSRSNSFNFDISENCARPWGTVCSGSVARAFEKFNIRSEESPSKESSPGLYPCEQHRPQMLT